VEGIPLGLIPGTQYLPNAVPLRHGGLLILAYRRNQWVDKRSWRGTRVWTL